jgi:hypothetical protein
MKGPITKAALSKAWNVFARSNTGIMGSNPTQGMDMCVYSVFVLGSILATGWSPSKESYRLSEVKPSVSRMFCTSSEGNRNRVIIRRNKKRHRRNRLRPHISYYPVICLQELWKSANNMSQKTDFGTGFESCTFRAWNETGKFYLLGWKAV